MTTPTDKDWLKKVLKEFEGELIGKSVVRGREGGIEAFNNLEAAILKEIDRIIGDTMPPSTTGLQSAIDYIEGYNTAKKQIRQRAGLTGEKS
jgi:hypothetical protein